MFINFKKFLVENEKSWIRSTFNHFKSELESKVKEYTKKPFEVIASKHFFDQVELRSGDDPKFKGNVHITADEMKHIYDRIEAKFFTQSHGNGGLIKVKSPTNFKINPKYTTVNRDNTQTAEWEFQHKITFDNHFRCVLYSLVIVIKKENGKDVIVDKPKVKMITILPSNKEGKDDFPLTNELNESIELEYFNELED